LKGAENIIISQQPKQGQVNKYITILRPQNSTTNSIISLICFARKISFEQAL